MSQHFSLTSWSYSQNWFPFDPWQGYRITSDPAKSRQASSRRISPVFENIQYWKQNFICFFKKTELKTFGHFSPYHHQLTGGRLTKNQLIEIVFFQLIETFIISWPKFWTLFSWSKVLIMSLIKRLKFSQLIELFDQLTKKNGQILAVDQIFFKA